MKKKILAIVLSVLCVTMILPTTSFASDVAPTITTQPVQPAAPYLLGNWAKALTVVAEADGGTLSYQWYSTDDPSENGAVIEDAIESSFTPTNGAVGSFYYYCVVKDVTNGLTTKSDVVCVMVADSFSITNVSPASPVTIAEGITQTVDFTCNVIIPNGSYINLNSSDTNVAKVTKGSFDGTNFPLKVTGVSAGSARITFDLYDPDGNVLVEKEIVVKVGNIEPQTLTFDSETLTKTYGDAAFTQAVKGAHTTVTYSSSDTSVATVDSSTGEVTIVKPGATTIKASAAAGSGYKSAEKTYTLTVNAKELTVVGTAVNQKTYDGTTDGTVGITGTLTGAVPGDDVSIDTSVATFDNKNARNGHDVTVKYTLKGSKAGNYTVKDSTTTADIEKKEINVKADDKSSYVGSELEKLNYTADELISGDFFTGELSTDADKEIIGTSDIIQNTLSVNDGNEGKNYTINYTKGTYTVTAKEIQTLEFAGVTDGKVTKTYGDEAFTEIVTGAETEVTYSSSDTSVAAVDEKTGKVTILKAGTTVIKATAKETAVSAEGTAQYILTVSKIRVDVPEVVTGLIYSGEEQTGVELPKNALYTLTDNAKTDAGDYTAVACLKDKENYEWNIDVPASADQEISWSIARAKATVTADNQSMYLGDKVPTFTAKVTGLIGADKIKYSFNTLNPAAQGTYSIVPSGDATQGSYDVTYVQGVLAVTGKESNAKADPAGPAEILKEYQAKEEYKDKTLDVEVRTDQEIPEKSKAAINKVVASGKKIQFMETNLFLIIKSEGKTSEKNIGDENDTLISVTYKFDFTNKKDIQVFRGHETSDGSVVVDELTEKANANGETISYNKEKGEITITGIRFSTFAVAYNEVAVPATGDRNNVWLYILIAALALGAAAGAGIAMGRKAGR